MIKKFAPHFLIITSMMYIVFFAIDRVNQAMAFINNDITKYLLFIQCIVTIIFCAAFIISEYRRGK